MLYRKLGKTGLKVSVLGYGNWMTGDQPNSYNDSLKAVKKAWELGINLYDTAEQYGYGDGEKHLGNIIKELQIPREDIIISTKLFWGIFPFQDLKQSLNQVGLSRKHIKEGVKNSLKRLQLDYVDIIFCHRFDHETSLEEVAQSFTELIQQGYIHYWGTSEWSAQSIFEMKMICREKNLIEPTLETPEYNFFERKKMENEYCRLFDNYQLGAITWSPLFYGILGGQYNNGDIPEGSRFDKHREDGYFKLIQSQYFEGENKQKLKIQLNELNKLAQNLGMSQAQLALSWVIANKDVASTLTSCSKPEQLEELAKCIQLYQKINPDVNQQIDSIFGNAPSQDLNWKTFVPIQKRR